MLSEIFYLFIAVHVKLGLPLVHIRTYMYMRKGLGIYLENCEKPAATGIEPGASDFSR